MDRKLKDWIMYHEVKRLLSQGSSQRQIASVLGLHRHTVKKYASMTERDVRLPSLSLSAETWELLNKIPFATELVQLTNIEKPVFVNPVMDPEPVVPISVWNLLRVSIV